MVEAEAELRAAQWAHNGSYSAVMRYRLARDRVNHLEVVGLLLLAESAEEGQNNMS